MCFVVCVSCLLLVVVLRWLLLAVCKFVDVCDCGCLSFDVCCFFVCCSLFIGCWLMFGV